MNRNRFRPPFDAALAITLSAVTGTALAQSAEDAAPSVPTGLSANAYSATAAGVAWMPAEDDVGIGGYEVTLDGEIVQQGGARSYIDFELTPATAYRVGVTAIDTAGQRSETAFVEFSTDGGTTAGSGPAPIEGLRASVYSPTALGLAWTRPAAPGLRYEISRDDDVLGETDGTSFVDTDLTPGAYRYEVVAIDADGARSEPTGLDVATVEDAGSGDEADPTPSDGNTILDIAVTADGFDTLVEVLGGYPDLVGTLGDETAELTVFAPTDEAFAAAPLGGAGVDEIERILAYHVVPGTVFNTLALEEGTSIPTLLETAEGGSLEIVDDGDGSLSVVDAGGNAVAIDTVVDSASNGVIYVIDAVLSPPPVTDEDGDAGGDEGSGEPETPPAAGTIVEVAALADGFDSLIEVLGGYPDLVAALDDEAAELIVFAPTDEAFAATDLGGLGVDGIENVLAYHVVAVDETLELPVGEGESTTLTTVQGGTLDIVADGAGGLSVTDAAGNSVPVEATVDTASNGVIYVVGSVLSAPPAP